MNFCKNKIKPIGYCFFINGHAFKLNISGLQQVSYIFMKLT